MDESTPKIPPDGPGAPDEVAGQVALPFDDTADEPIAFSLTARARRTVAPEDLPPLRVVVPAPGTEDRAVTDDDPGDTRPARARALRRAGADPDAIARQLGVDELLVRAWIDGLRAPRSPATAAASAEARADADDTAFQLARAAATEVAAGRLPTEPRLAAGAAIVAVAAEIDAGAVTVRTGDARVARLLAQWFVDAAGADLSRLRVVLRVGSAAAGDLVRHRWARALGIPTERVRVTRWAAAPTDTAVEGLLRLADPDAAAGVAGWRDALLDGALDHDVVF